MVEGQANNALAALQDFYADPNNTHIPSVDELVSTTGLETDHRISLFIEGDANEIRIQAAHKTANCPNGESYVLSITDDVDAHWQ